MVRAARASAALDGAELPLTQVRKMVVPQRNSAPAATAPDPLVDTVLRALRVTAAAMELGAVLRTAPAQALARLHLAASGDGSESDGVGRPRPAGVEPRDLVDLGPAPTGEELSQRLELVGGLLSGARAGSAVVLVAVVHGELLTLRPFPSGNGLVARAVSRALVVETGLDPTGVAVPEVGLLAGGAAQYIGAAAAYASGYAGRGGRLDPALGGGDRGRCRRGQPGRRCGAGWTAAGLTSPEGDVSHRPSARPRPAAPGSRRAASTGRAGRRRHPGRSGCRPWSPPC